MSDDRTASADVSSAVGAAARTNSWWLIYLLVGFGLTVLFGLLPDVYWTIFLYFPIAVARVVATIAAYRIYRPTYRRPWRFLIAGSALWTVAEAISLRSQVLGYSGERVTPADALSILGYLCIALALTSFLFGRERRVSINGVLEGAIVVIALMLQAWVFLVVPTTTEALNSGLPATLRMTYPISDLLLIGLLVWLGGSHSVRTRSYTMFFASFLVWGFTNAAYHFTTFSSEIGNEILQYTWLISYVLWGAAVLHPSVRGFWAPRPESDDVFTVNRFVMLLAAALSAPVALLVQVGLHQQLNVLAVSVSTIIIVLLFTVRIARVVRSIRHQAQSMITISSTDSVTGLPNRRRFLERVSESLATAGAQPAVLHIELDRFRSISDALGLDVSNEVLQVLVERWSTRLRPDDVLARLGDDEFGVLLVGVVPDMEASAVAWSLQKALDDSIEASGLSLSIGANIGVAASDGAGHATIEPESVGVGVGVGIDADIDAEAAALARQAHMAALAAGDRLSHVVSFSREIDSQDAARILLLNELPGALERGDLVLHYQPKVDLGTGQVRGVEGLVRWQHPVHGLLMPDAFVPMVEQTTLIHNLTRYVINRALEDRQRWHRAGLPLDVAVNLSVRNLLNPSLFDDVRSALHDREVPPTALELEVTESSAMSDFPGSLSMLASLHELGVALSIDDYGTGYGSLAYLCQLPMSTLKIDRTFVDRMVEHQSDAAIVRSTIELARSLGLTVVAEGVENAETLHLLRGLGCDSAQGYYFSRPVPAERIPALVREIPAGFPTGLPR